MDSILNCLEIQLYESQALLSGQGREDARIYWQGLIDRWRRLIADLGLDRETAPCTTPQESWPRYD